MSAAILALVSGGAQLIANGISLFAQLFTANNTASEQKNAQAAKDQSDRQSIVKTIVEAEKTSSVTEINRELQ